MRKQELIVKKNFEMIDKNTEKKSTYSFNKYVERDYITILGNIKLKRAYYYNKDDKMGLYPVELNHRILKDTCFPEVKEMVCYTACIEPYAKSHEVLAKLSNINISSAEIQKITKEIGSELVNKEDQLIITPIKYPSVKKEQNKKMAISMDGAMINTNEGWKEVKSGVIYQFKDNDKKPESPISYNKSYISRIENCDDFGKRLKEEARRRGYLDVTDLVILADGAKWIWDLAEKDYPFSIQIVDWYHAKQHLYNIVNLLYDKKDSKIINDFTEKLADYLYYGNISKLNDEVQEKKIQLNITDTEKLSNIKTEMEYFIKNAKRMQYNDFRKKGYPIGSGIVEATCKQLVQLRLKRNGMKWKKDGAHSILQLRCYYLGNRWDEVNNIIWQKVA